MLSPGPANLVSFALASRFGFTGILRFQLGILVIYAAMAVVLGLATTQISKNIPHATTALQIIGGLFIAYLGLRLAFRKQAELPDNYTPRFSNGLILQILNPKYPPVVLAVFANRPNESSWITAGIIVAIGAVGLLLYALAGSLVRSLFSTEKYFRTLDMVFGLLLVGIGIWFCVKAFFPV